MKLAPQQLRTYMVTAVTAQRRKLFLTHTTADLFISVLKENREKNRFALHAFVVMPDHVHLLLTPSPDISLEKVMQFLKGGFSFRLKSKMDVWERSYDSRRVEDIEQFETFLRYIEQNPVRAHRSDTPEGYAFGFHAYKEALDPPPTWFNRGESRLK